MNNKEMSVWCYSSLDEVRSQYGSDWDIQPSAIHYIKGKVEESIPADAPATIALLRFDTDFYESTYHELRHLFPTARARWSTDRRRLRSLVRCT